MKDALLVSRIDRLARLLAVFFTISLCLLGFFFHPVRFAASAENDFYVEKAQAILKGEVPQSKHPLLYPLLSATVSRTFRSEDPFPAAKIVSSLFAGLFVFLAYLLGKSCFDERVGLFALLSLVLNRDVIAYGITACAHTTYYAFALGVLLLCVKKEPTVKTSVVMAFLFVMAFLAHALAVVLLPLIAIWLGAYSSRTPKEKILAAFSFAVASAAFVYPISSG